MGKGDIRTRRGKVWRGTYGVTRPRRYKTVVRPHATTRKVKTLKDLPKATAEPVKKPVAETTPVIEKVQPVVSGVTAEVPQIVAEPAETASAETETKAKKPAAKKTPAAKKAPAKKK
jgi:30S ribosomal protein S31